MKIFALFVFSSFVLGIVIWRKNALFRVLFVIAVCLMISFIYYFGNQI